MIRRPPRSTQSRSSAASDVYKRQLGDLGEGAGKEVHGRIGGVGVEARAVLDGDALGHPARGGELRARLQGALRDKREADAFHYVSVEATSFCGLAQGL